MAVADIAPVLTMAMWMMCFCIAAISMLATCLGGMGYDHIDVVLEYDIFQHRIDAGYD